VAVGRETDLKRLVRVIAKSKQEASGVQLVARACRAQVYPALRVRKKLPPRHSVGNMLRNRRRIPRNRRISSRFAYLFADRENLIQHFEIR